MSNFHDLLGCTMIMMKVHYKKTYTETNSGTSFYTVINLEKKRLVIFFLEIKWEHKCHPLFSFGFSALSWLHTLLLQKLFHIPSFKHICCHTELSVFKPRVRLCKIKVLFIRRHVDSSPGYFLKSSVHLQKRR